MTGLALLAPHVFVEDVTVEASARRASSTSTTGCASAWRATTTTPTPRSRAGATSGSTRPSATGASSPRRRGSPRPTLLIQGADDPYGTLEQLDRIEARVHRPASGSCVPGGHSPHLDEPAAVTEAIARFAAELS